MYRYSTIGTAHSKTMPGTTKNVLNFQVIACCSCEDIVHIFAETVLSDMMHGSTEKVSTSYSWHIEALNTDSTAADLGPHSSRQDTECQILLPNDWNSVEILQ